MAGDELARRRPVWVALADLFLDTDVRLNYVPVIRALAASPYSIGELWTILDDEVTPALQGNLLQVAGEWAMFDDEWVVEQVAPRAGKRRWLPNAVSMEREWDELRPLVERIRSLPDEASREQRLRVWSELMPLLLTVLNRPGVEHCAAVGRAEAERILREELMPAMMPGVRRLAAKGGGYPGERDVEDNWKRFAEALR